MVFIYYFISLFYNQVILTSSGYGFYTLSYGGYNKGDKTTGFYITENPAFSYYTNGGEILIRKIYQGESLTPTVQPTAMPTIAPNTNPPENRTYIVYYNGYAYSTLDDVDPNNSTTVCSNDPKKLPSNWELAPYGDYFVQQVAMNYFWQGNVRTIYLYII